MFRSLWRIYSSVTLGQLLDELLNKISHALALLHISAIFYIFCCEYCSSHDVYIHDSQILHLTAWGNGGILPGFVVSRIHAAGPRLQIFSHSYSCCFLMAVSYPRINFCGAAVGDIPCPLRDQAGWSEPGFLPLSWRAWSKFCFVLWEKLEELKQKESQTPGFFHPYDIF